MTQRQKRIIAVLGVANVLFFATLLIVVTRFSGSASGTQSSATDADHLAEGHIAPACQRLAVRKLSQVGLGGTVTKADETLQFDLVYRGAQEEDVAQQVWTAFDVGLALADDQCDTFSRIEIVIEADDAPRPRQVFAAVNMADLEAYHGGELGETAFIDRVQYRIEPVGDTEF